MRVRSAASNNKLEIPFPADQGSSTSIEVITSPTLSGLLGMVVWQRAAINNLLPIFLLNQKP